MILTHWGRVTHICVGKLTTIGSNNGLSPERRQAITWTNVGILLIGPLGTNVSEFLSGIQTCSFKETHLKLSSPKWRPFCLGLDVLIMASWHGWWGFTIAGLLCRESGYRWFHRCLMDFRHKGTALQNFDVPVVVSLSEQTGEKQLSCWWSYRHRRHHHHHHHFHHILRRITVKYKAHTF